MVIISIKAPSSLGLIGFDIGCKFGLVIGWWSKHWVGYPYPTQISVQPGLFLIKILILNCHPEYFGVFSFDDIIRYVLKYIV